MRKPITLVRGYRSELGWSGGSVNLGWVPDEAFDLSVDIAVCGYHSLAEGDGKQVRGDDTTESDEGDGGGLEGHESSFQSWYVSHYSPCKSCDLKNL